MIERSADADLDDPPRVQQTLLDRTPERRSVMEPGTEIVVARVAMGVDVRHPNRAGSGDRGRIGSEIE